MLDSSGTDAGSTITTKSICRNEDVKTPMVMISHMTGREHADITVYGPRLFRESVEIYEYPTNRAASQPKEMLFSKLQQKLNNSLVLPTD